MQVYLLTHLITTQDREFKDQVESCEYSVPQFDHRAHLRLAYVYLVQQNDAQAAVSLMKVALINLLKHAGIEPSTKYHETLTEAWIFAVHHFLSHTESSTSADDFIEQHPVMLDSKIMLSHYTEEVLFSEVARRSFVEPNLDPIPRH